MNRTQQVKNSSIELVAQEWPGQAEKPFNMPVNSGLDSLKFGNPVDLEIKGSDLVLGLIIEGEEIAVPLSYLEGFEVANLKVNNQSYMLTWCGLVGSAQLFDCGETTKDSGYDFGRALKNNNLLMVDRKTNSVWNQLSKTSIHGQSKGQKLQLSPSIQTTWAFWKSKYPDTKVLCNKDTTGAAFPSLLFSKPFYTSWKPELGRFYMKENHQIDNLGLGIELQDSVVFFPLTELFKSTSPIKYNLSSQAISVHFSEEGLTAWVEDNEGQIIPSAMVYDWAWETFNPNSIRYQY